MGIFGVNKRRKTSIATHKRARRQRRDKKVVAALRGGHTVLDTLNNDTSSTLFLLPFQEKSSILLNQGKGNFSELQLGNNYKNDVGLFNKLERGTGEVFSGEDIESEAKWNAKGLESRQLDFDPVGFSFGKFSKFSPAANRLTRREADPNRAKLARQGVRITGHIIKASCLAAHLFGSQSVLSRSEFEVNLIDEFQEFGMSEKECQFLTEIVFHRLRRGKRCSTSVCGVGFQDFLYFMSYFMDQARTKKDGVEFVFELFDDDCSKTLDFDEVSSFLDLFWNKKLENIISLEGGQEAFEIFMNRVLCNENFEFYMLMKQVLQKPYISLDKFQEIVDTYIKAGSNLELNLPDCMRSHIVNKAAEFLEASPNNCMMKTAEFESVVDEVKSLLTQKVDEFTEKMKKHNVVADQLMSEFLSENDYATLERQLDYVRSQLEGKSLARQVSKKGLPKKKSSKKMVKTKTEATNASTESVGSSISKQMESRLARAEKELKRPKLFLNVDQFKQVVNRNAALQAFVEDIIHVFDRTITAVGNKLESSARETEHHKGIMSTESDLARTFSEQVHLLN